MLKESSVTLKEPAILVSGTEKNLRKIVDYDDTGKPPLEGAPEVESMIQKLHQGEEYAEK